jgi:hypothetical protein
MLGFFTFISSVAFKDNNKPSTGHSHFHATKPDNKYIIEEKLPPHVKREDIIFEVFMR